MQNQSPPPVRVHVFVSGVVQGVGYRYSTRNQAKYFGLGGWVRNLPDGRVEAVFEGSKKAVEGMISWCWNTKTRRSIPFKIAPPRVLVRSADKTIKSINCG